jgi:predicted nucleotidyltransferase component of viral defense system
MFNRNKHREILFNLIRKIYSSPAGQYLGFKGGTMLYFFYELDRFSVDLDFDLLDLEKSDLVKKELEKILVEFGEIKDQMDKENTLFFLLDYGEGESNVKIEISKIGLETNEYEVKNFYGIDLKTQVIEDSFANKLVASLERNRTANRDFFDIEFMFRKGFDFNEKIIEARTGKKAEVFLRELLDFLKSYEPSRGWLDGLGELVDEEKKIWVRDNLKREVMGRVEFWLEKGNK